MSEKGHLLFFIVFCLTELFAANYKAKVDFSEKTQSFRISLFSVQMQFRKFACSFHDISLSQGQN